MRETLKILLERGKLAVEKEAAKRAWATRELSRSKAVAKAQEEKLQSEIHNLHRQLRDAEVLLEERPHVADVVAIAHGRLRLKLASEAPHPRVEPFIGRVFEEHVAERRFCFAFFRPVVGHAPIVIRFIIPGLSLFDRDQRHVLQGMTFELAPRRLFLIEPHFLIDETNY